MEVRAQPTSVSVNREVNTQVLVCFEEGPPALLDLSSGASRPVPCIPVGQSLSGESNTQALSHRCPADWQRSPCAKTSATFTNMHTGQMQTSLHLCHSVTGMARLGYVHINWMKHALDVDSKARQDSNSSALSVPAETEVRKGSRSALSGQLTASAVFSRDGRCIYLGQSRGLLSVLDTASLRFLDTVKV